MSEEDALLSAIATHPGDDTGRLAYADWLDEHGRHGRAEFIRVQIEIAQHRGLWPADRGPRSAELVNRENVLLGTLRESLLGTLGAVRSRLTVEFDRGFPVELRMYVGVFVEHGAAIAAFQPRPRVIVHGVIDRWYDMFTDRYLPAVTHAAMHEPGGMRGDWGMSSSIVRSMTDLGRHNNRLRGLDLGGCRVGDQGLIYFAEDADVWQVETLDLSGNDIFYVGLIELLESSIARRLRTLNLGDNPLTETALLALARNWPERSALEELNLESVVATDEARGALRERFGAVVQF